MSSPFSTFEEFANAEGPIYTFANSPAIITIFLLLSLAITVYFFYASFGMKQDMEKSVDVKALGLLLVAGLTTIAGTLFNPNLQKQSEATQARSRLEQPNRGLASLGLLGMMGLGGANIRRTRRPASRRTRSGKRSHLTR